MTKLGVDLKRIVRYCQIESRLYLGLSLYGSVMPLVIHLVVLEKKITLLISLNSAYGLTSRITKFFCCWSRNASFISTLRNCNISLYYHNSRVEYLITIYLISQLGISQLIHANDLWLLIFGGLWAFPLSQGRNNIQLHCSL